MSKKLDNDEGICRLSTTYYLFVCTLRTTHNRHGYVEPHRTHSGTRPRGSKQKKKKNKKKQNLVEMGENRKNLLLLHCLCITGGIKSIQSCVRSKNWHTKHIVHRIHPYASYGASDFWFLCFFIENTIAAYQVRLWR